MLVGITGAKGSGKDTFAETFTRKNFFLVKMADTLKDMLRTLYRAADVDEETIERKIEGDLKEEPCEILGGSTPRWAMQSLGTEWAKMVDPTHTLWSRIWEKRVAPLLLDGTPIVCTDVRFHHEAEVVRRLGGHLLRIERSGQATGDAHISETEMNEIQVDETVYNHTSVSALHRKAEAFLKDATQ